MTSAANRAAKALLGASRNRPSRSMSQSFVSRSSTNSGGDCSGVDGSTPGNSNAGTSAPPFMQDVQSQHESLSEKLLKENATEPSSAVFDSSDVKSKKASRKVQWAETAAIASTMDGNNNNNTNSDDDDPDYFQRSPMDILSDLFQKKYTLPIFLLLTTAIFLMVHLA
eukprot:CAMPEP_0172316920 /NCGR_PEP_ID=MMETSP1058-20130122/29977_1 /TAXON_ID=83371 /ORGANISM="Detonula confervacea, Strain CCMP 353" /LENGTH=167 /DNA_ID=CAMNT_0013031359 /DNA_START=206 /DNA_END=706 /DNA_ORIENTATION=+